MKKIKKGMLSVLIAFSLTTPSYSAIPVIDFASIAKVVEEIILLKKQIDVLNNQLNAEVGNTAFSDFLKDTVKDAHSAVPTSFTKDLRDIINTDTGVTGLKTLAENLKKEHLTVKSSDVFIDATRYKEAKKRFEKDADEIFSGMAVAQSAYNKSGQRKAVLDQLRKAIKNAHSPKEREQLLLRITVENSLLLNDLQQLMAFQILSEHQRRASEFNRSANIKTARPNLKK